MTNYNARSKGKTPKASNKKDGATGRGSRRNADQDAQFEALGFEMIDWNKWSYTWAGEFPAIRLVPGIVDFAPGWVAICEDGRQIPLGQATPAEIKRRLDDEILEIMRFQAELNDLPIAEIFEEIDFDSFAEDALWVTRPQAAARQRTQAVRDFARKNGLSLDEADEMILERGE